MMSFAVFADGTANLPGRLLDGISLLPCDYTMDGVPGTYLGDLDAFDAHAYYDHLRSGRVIKTTLLNTELFLARFTPLLQQGIDVIYVSMSSGISGTYNAAVAAAQELMTKFNDRFVHIVDSLGCGFGSGMLAIQAADLSSKGTDAREAATILDAEVSHACQYFTVDDLNYLKRTGRVSGFTAKIATVLNIQAYPVWRQYRPYRFLRKDQRTQESNRSAGAKVQRKANRREKADRLYLPWRLSCRRGAAVGHDSKDNS